MNLNLFKVCVTTLIKVISNAADTLVVDPKQGLKLCVGATTDRLSTPDKVYRC